MFGTESKEVPSVTVWCNACNAEPAVATIEAEVFGEDHQLDVGRQCLTSLLEAGKL